MKRRALAGALLPVVLVSPLFAAWCTLCLSGHCSPGAMEKGLARVVAPAPEAMPPCHMAGPAEKPEPDHRAALTTNSLTASDCCTMGPRGVEAPPAVTPASTDAFVPAPAALAAFTVPRPEVTVRAEGRPAPPPEASPPLYTLNSSWLI